MEIAVPVSEVFLRNDISYDTITVHYLFLGHHFDALVEVRWVDPIGDRPPPASARGSRFEQRLLLGVLQVTTMRERRDRIHLFVCFICFLNQLGVTIGDERIPFLEEFLLVV